MHVAIRVDASREIGTGHLMRCLTLADALRQRGAKVRFISRQMPEHLQATLAAAMHEVVPLPTTSGPDPLDDLTNARWLRTSQAADAEDTIRALSDHVWDWIVVDHYALDMQWELAVRGGIARVLVIDDLADRQHDADLLLDQNLVAQMQTRYVGKVPAACGMLLGPEYAMLQPMYAELHDCAPHREGPIRRILIYFGGADEHNLTGRSLSAFMSLCRPDIGVDVVLVANSPHASTIRHQVVGHANVRLHCSLPTLAPLIAKADLAIGAGGATSWERLCLGLPALVVTLAENQRPIADELCKRNLIRWIGNQEEVDDRVLAEALGTLIQQGLHGDWSRRCLAIIDGKGVSRVCAAMTVTATTPLRTRHATLEDEALLLKWANEESTRRNAFCPERISAETHRNWFRSRLDDLKSCHLYLVETEEGVPVGQVRFDRGDHAWGIDYALAPHFRGRGLGGPLLQGALLRLREVEPGAIVSGRVKQSNQPSCRVFESLHFDARQTGDIVEFQRLI